MLKTMRSYSLNTPTLILNTVPCTLLIYLDYQSIPKQSPQYNYTITLIKKPCILHNVLQDSMPATVNIYCSIFIYT